MVSGATFPPLGPHFDQPNMNVYISLVTLGPKEGPDAFLDEVAKVLSDPKSDTSKHKKSGDLEIKLISATLGSHDAVILWQSKTPEAGRAFVKEVLGDCQHSGHKTQTIVCMSCFLHGTIW